MSRARSMRLSDTRNTRHIYGRRVLASAEYEEYHGNCLQEETCRQFGIMIITRFRSISKKLRKIIRGDHNKIEDGNHFGLLGMQNSSIKSISEKSKK